MNQFIGFFCLLPLLGYLVSLCIPRLKESAIATVVIGTIGIHLSALVSFISYWMIIGRPVLDKKQMVIHSTGNIEIALDFYMDNTTAVFALVGSVLALLVTIFSRYYIHRDGGYKRFFVTIMLFFLGYNLLIFSGNYETLFAGWEILGVCTFLLVSFYRDRYLPVKNSMKVISIYRLGDICLVLAMWMSHHMWHSNIMFHQFSDAALISHHFQEHYGEAMFISFLIFIAAAVKSAQLPFSSWLPRAMEGPTSSSAIFYGSLSVHIGVFLLLRTYPYWEHVAAVKLAIIFTGIITSVISINFAKQQSALKAQIAYSSIAQIGLMFVEVALGFHTLALMHFAGNAFLRTYQLLVSPSVQSYLVHNMVFNFAPKRQSSPGSPWYRWSSSLYMLSLKELNLDNLLKRFLWDPFKWIGKSVGIISHKVMSVSMVVIFIAGLGAFYFIAYVPESVLTVLPEIISLSGMLLILRSFTERESALYAWLHVFAGQVFTTLAIALHNEAYTHTSMSIYLGSTFIAAIPGYLVLRKMRKIDNNIDLDRYHGYAYEQPKLGVIFLLASLGIAGLPITPAFIGIDLLFSHIHKSEEVLILSTSVSIIFIELSVLRIYSRIFMGQHKKPNHAIAYRSS